MADAALKRFWSAQRSGPTQLSNKQAVALAGTLYTLWSGAIEDNPGTSQMWERVLGHNHAARAGTYAPSPLNILPADSVSRRTASMELRFGAMVDVLLAREGLVIDATSRERLLRAVVEAMDDAARRLKRNASGDYSPDAAAARFPQWEPPAEAAPATAPSTVNDLLDRWLTYQADKMAANTLKRYGASIRALSEFLGRKDIREVTGDDLYAWAEHRRDREGVSARVINKNDLVAASSMLRWASSRSGGTVIASNPARGVRLDEPRNVETREKTFRQGEIAAILQAAAAVPADDANPTFEAAKRWCPWLAAYSGARITELTYLRKQDIRQEGDSFVMHLWKTKTGTTRTVPLHQHLLDRGFLDFVRASGSGPLFYDPIRHNAKAITPPAEMRAQKIAAWVRDAANLDMAVDPNHGWRHTWKSIALGVGIPERVSDAITGHAVRSVARRYETPAIDVLIAAMVKFPRYKVDLTG